MPASPSQQPQKSPIQGYVFTCLLFGGVIIIWWFYGNPFGTVYETRMFWQLGLNLALAASLSYIELKVVDGRFSVASIINFSSMLILPPVFMPLIALALSVIYERDTPLFAGFDKKVFNFSMYLYIYFAAGYTYDLLGPASFSKVTPEMVGAVIIAYLAWIVVNFGLITVRLVVYREADPLRIMRLLPREFWSEAIIVPIGLVHSVLLSGDDFLLFLIWSCLLTGSGLFAYRLSRLQSQARVQNEQLLRQKEELERGARREHSTGIILAQTAGRLSSIALDQGTTISQQFEQLNEIASILEQLNSSALQIAQSSSRVALSAEQSLEAAYTGQSSLYNSRIALKELQGYMERLVAQTNEMAAQSREIDQLVEVIQEIAEETHLLAVNATIEARGAGEFGSRFAVIANQVNELAARSRSSSQQTQKVVTRLRNAVEEVLTGIQQGQEQTVYTGKTMDEATGRTDEIIQSTHHTNELARTISIATEQQQHGSNQATSTIARLLEMAEGAVRLSEKSRETAAQLDKLSESLRREQSARPSGATGKPAVPDEANFPPAKPSVNDSGSRELSHKKPEQAGAAQSPKERETTVKL